MLVLALDTSSAAVTAAVVELAETSVATRSTQQVINPRGHGEHLAPLISACLDESGTAPADLAAVVAGTGPGPYTGLRVGLVTAAVLAETLGIPTYGVCSLDGIAGAVDEPDVLVAADARRKEVYWALYRAGERVRGPEVSRPADVPTQTARAMTGAGARMYRDVLGLPLLTADHPDPAALVRTAAGRIRRGDPSETLTPLYLRRPDAVEPGARKQVTP